jgi:Na+:H+ antiporter, NhaA family
MDHQSPRAPIDRLIRPFQVFAKNKLAGAILLLGATAAALIWANSPWAASYTALLGLKVTAGAGSFVVSKPLLLWINDGLMGFFFFVVGLEIKRELLAGELATLRKATLPIAAAVGGMGIPALIYLLFNRGGPGANGWGIPMATDIAFALGILALLGDRVPTGLKVLLTALAIVDDIGAILVIAIFYTQGIALASLAVGGALFVASIVANIAGVRSTVVYFLLGMAVWLAFLKSGVHATLAAVLMAMTIPSRTRVPGEQVIDRLVALLDALRSAGVTGGRRMLTQPQQHVVHGMERLLEDASAPLQRLEHGLVGLVTFVVLPIFALANAGVALGDGLGQAIRSPICLGIIAGLFLGKQLGVLGFSWLVVKLGLAALPDRVSWRQVHGVGVLAGIGFTMSLFVAGLAFPGAAGQQDVAKLGILAASLLSGLVGVLLLRGAVPPRSA